MELLLLEEKSMLLQEDQMAEMAEEAEMYISLLTQIVIL